MTFLYATDSKLRSSTVSSWSDEATRFMFSTISREWRNRNLRPNGVDELKKKDRLTFIALCLFGEFGEINGVFSGFGHLKGQGESRANRVQGPRCDTHNDKIIGGLLGHVGEFGILA
jgi:hypothetical protein